MTGFLNIEKINLPNECILDAYIHMRNCGKRQLEGVALFAGFEESNSFIIERTIIPKQTASSLEEGLLYAVDGEELHRINKSLYETNQCLIAQIHSHPTRAYHSGTDDAFPIITTVGGISIVIPNFASQKIDLDNWAVFRLSIKSKWERLTLKEQRSLINII